MNKKIVIAAVSSIILSVGLFSNCGRANVAPQKEADSSKQIVLRLADNQNEGYVTVRADRKFAEIVEQKSKGRIIVDVYPGGHLGDEKSVIEQVQFGAIDLMRVSVTTLSEVDKKLGVLMLPYIYRDSEHMFKVLDGPIGDKIMTGLGDYKLTGLCWFDAGSRNFYNTKREIKSPEDLIGLKIRVPESKLMIDMVRTLGASSSPMTYSEVYNGLETGVIDGAENNWLSYISANHYEVAKYITIDEHTRVPEMIIAGKMGMDNLSKDDVKILRDAATEAAIFQRQEWVKDEEEYKKKITDRGVTITRLANKKAFQEKLKPLYETYAKEYGQLIQDIINTK